MKTQTSKTRALLAVAALVALGATPLARADYSNTVVSQSPVGYWRLSETTASPPPVTTAANLGSSAGGNGTYNGSSGFFRGQPGAVTGDTAIHMDGSAQSVTVPYNADQNPAGNFTVECWLKADVSGTQCPISIGHFGSPRSGWLIYQVSSTGYELRLYNTNGTNPSLILGGNTTNVVGVWTHVVATFDGTTARIYLNGTEAANGTPTGPPNYVPGTDGQFSLGMRSDTGFPWAGGADEVAFYPSVLTPAEIATHYAAASTNAGAYVSFVTGKSPLLYLRLNEAGNTTTVNLGTKGAAGNGEFTTGVTPAQAGPRPATFPGFDSLNNAVGFSGVGSVALAPLNLNTNTVTISCWANPQGLQKLAAGLVVCDAGGTVAGLTMDPISEGYGLGYSWAGTRNVSFTADLGLPSLQDSVWSYCALVITPTNATIYVCDANNAANWASATDNFNANNANQLFSAATLVGMDGAFTNRNFVGNMDEVAIFNRSLGQGELYTEYATAVGGVAPRIFTDIQGPAGTVAVGDPIVLTVDAGGTGPLTFTWRTNAVTVAVTSSNTFVIPTAALTDSGNYDVVIANGSGSITSGPPANVTVVVPTTPTIVSTAGFNNRTLYKGASLKLGVTATGGGLKYNWFKNNILVSSGASSTYTISSVTNSDAGSYSVSITNSAGVATNGPVAIAIPVKATNSYEGVMITAAPEAWWRLDEASGSIGSPMVDAMGRHDGYYTNAAGGVTIPTLGVPGALTTNLNTAATFTSSGQGIGLVPFSPALNPGKHSIEAWVKTSVIDGQVPVSTFYNGKGSWMQSVNVSGVGQWLGGNNSGTFGNNLSLNTNDVIVPGFWCHVVVLYDESVQSSGTFYPYRLYVNGQTDGYIWGDGGSGANAAGPLIIGARGVSAASLADRFFDGQVDEVAVYQRVLSAAEIQSHFAARGSVVIPPTLSQPLSQTVIAGKTVRFSSTVSGDSPSLRWYKGSSPITGATSSSYSITNVSVADSGTYTLWATNSAATNSVSATLTVISPVQYANVTNNLVLHLPFDGDVADTSGRGNNATPVGSPTFVTAAVGNQAFHFDTAGTTRNYATLGATIPPDLSFSSNVNFSVSYWIRLPASGLPGDLPILCSAENSYGNPGITIAPSYKLGGWSWYLNNTGLYGADGSINDGNWHNLIHTFDRAGNGLTYLDGILVNSTVISSVGNLDRPGAMNIGQDATGAYPEDGAMDLDDLGIWRRVLTPLEAASIESAGRAGRSFNTVAPASVTLTISSSGGNVVVGYPSGTLQQSDSVGASAVWTTVSGASAPSYTTSPTNATKFYRVLVQ